MPAQNDINAAWRMGGITVGAVEDYIYSLLPARDEVLTEIEAEAAKRNIPIVGPAVGRILYQLATDDQRQERVRAGLGGRLLHHLVGPRRGRRRPRDLHRRRPQESRRSPRIFRPRRSDQTESPSKPATRSSFSPRRKQQFDIIFNDVDKEDYPRVFKLVLPRLRKGGLFVTDNVLWSGKVAQEDPSEASTKAILEFNRLALQLA